MFKIKALIMLATAQLFAADKRTWISQIETKAGSEVVRESFSWDTELRYTRERSVALANKAMAEFRKKTGRSAAYMEVKPLGSCFAVFFVLKPRK